jgi:hypothetical protein
MAMSLEYEALINELELDELDVCMNPHAPSCSVCIFNTRKWPSGIPWCNPEERKAKQLLDIQRREA